MIIFSVIMIVDRRQKTIQTRKIDTTLKVQKEKNYTEN
jgi:hypothetical protein